MKIIKNTENIKETNYNDFSLEKIILLIENDNFIIARNLLDKLILENKNYSDAYVYRFLANMNLKDYDGAAIDILTGFYLEQNVKFNHNKYNMADIVREFWFYSSNIDREGLKTSLRNIKQNLRIVK